MNERPDLFGTSMKLVAKRQLPVVDLVNAAERLTAQGEPQSAAKLYTAWIAHNADNGGLYAIHFNLGALLMASGDHAGAIDALRESVRLKPDFELVHINLGRALKDSGRHGEAVEQWLVLVKMLSAVNVELGDAQGHRIA